MSQRLYRWVIRTALLAVVAAVWVGDDWVRTRDAARYGPTPFDPVAWRAGDDRQRGRMAADLAARQPFRGRSRVDVLTALGPPDYDWDGGCQYVYRQGSTQADVLGYLGWGQLLTVCFSDADDSAVVILD